MGISYWIGMLVFGVFLLVCLFTVDLSFKKLTAEERKQKGWLIVSGKKWL